MGEDEGRHWGLWIGILVVLAVIAVGFYWWQQRNATPPTTHRPSASATLGPVTVQTRSVDDFPVGKTISQGGTLEGPIQGRCGEIAWNDLSPQAERDLRRLCPKGASGAAPSGGAKSGQ